MAGAPRPRRPGTPPKTTSFLLPPARRDPRGEGKELSDDGRRPTSCPWRRRGRGGSRCCIALRLRETHHHPRRRRVRSALLLARGPAARSGPLRAHVTASVPPARRPRVRTDSPKMLGRVCGGRASSGRSRPVDLPCVRCGVRDLPGLLPWPALLLWAMPADGAAPAPQEGKPHAPAIARGPRRPPRPTARLPRAPKARVRDGSILRARSTKPYAWPTEERSRNRARRKASALAAIAGVPPLS